MGMQKKGVDPTAGSTDTQIINTFATPLAVAHLPKPETLNQALRDLFVERAAQGERYSNPEPRVKRNKTLFESRFNLFDWPEPCVQTLKNFCMEQLFGVIRELNGYDDEMLKDIHYQLESWFHITTNTGYFAAHNHPNHAWSGVYCVRHDGDDPDSDSGKLTFINPNLASNMYIDVTTAHLKYPYSSAPIMLRLKPGQLVLFPSWLLHEVMPYEGNTERITVAFNARFRYVGTRQL